METFTRDAVVSVRIDLYDGVAGYMDSRSFCRRNLPCTLGRQGVKRVKNVSLQGNLGGVLIG